MAKIREIMNWLFRGDRDQLVVWIGKNGCAVLNADEGYCHSIEALTAHHFIKRHRLHEIERRPDGIAFAA